MNGTLLLTEEIAQNLSVVLVVLVSEGAVHGVELAVVGADLLVKSSSEFGDLGKTSVQASFETKS